MKKKKKVKETKFDCTHTHTYIYVYNVESRKLAARASRHNILLLLSKSVEDNLTLSPFFPPPIPTYLPTYIPISFFSRKKRSQRATVLVDSVEFYIAYIYL